MKDNYSQYNYSYKRLSGHKRLWHGTILATGYQLSLHFVPQQAMAWHNKTAWPTTAKSPPPKPSSRGPQPPPPPPPPKRHRPAPLGVKKEEDIVQPSSAVLRPRPSASSSVSSLDCSSGPTNDCSSGPTNKSCSEINHLMFTSYVLHAKLPDKKSLRGLIQHPGAFINAVICEQVHGAEWTEIKRLAEEHVLDGKKIHEVCQGCFLVTLDRMCQGVTLHPTMTKLGFTLGVVEVTLMPPQPPVMLGLLISPLSQEDPPMFVLESIHNCIETYGIRILSGIFPNCRDDSKLARMLCQAGAACPPLRQPFWGRDGFQYVWPHQVILFGPANKVLAVADDDIPSWDGMTDRFDIAGDDLIQRLYGQMTHVESPSQPNEIWAKNLSRPRFALAKQKSVSWRWWIHGTHQIVLWIDGRTPKERRGSGSQEKRQAWCARNLPW